MPPCKIFSKPIKRSQKIAPGNGQLGLEAKEIAASPSAPRNDGGRSFRLSRMTKLEVDGPRTTNSSKKEKVKRKKYR